MEYRGLKLDPFQEKAIEAISRNQSVLVAAPTGAGKTLIAEFALEKILKEGKRIVYTAPIKALSNQKFRDFSREYGNDIGVVTGDVTINPDARALIMTTEIFRNSILENPERLKDVSYVIFDEVHYLDDEERGTVWEESIIFAPKEIKIIALSATIPNINTLGRWIKNVRNDNLVVIEEFQRPVPLRHLLFLENIGVGNIKTLNKIKSMTEAVSPVEFKWNRTVRDSVVDYVVKQNQLPCLYFLFNRKDCERRAETNLKRGLLNDEEKQKAEEIFSELCLKYGLEFSNESVGFISSLISNGVAFHHAGMLPTLKEIVEQLFTKGLIKLLFATETFAVGVNMPARSVIFDDLIKFDGVRRNFIKSRDYHQMAGRAGRRGVDEVGFVYSYLKRPYIRPHFVEQITAGPIEPVKSQFNLSYACLLNLYHKLKENIYDVCAKSLSNFQAKPKIRVHRKTKDRGFKRGEICFAETVEQVRRKLRLLERMGYIRGQSLTGLGHFARQIYGYELIMGELFAGRVLEKLTPDELNILCVAIVFESKRREMYQRIPKYQLTNVYKPVMEVSNRIDREERKNGITELSKQPDFKLSGAAYAWSTGTPFEALNEWTSAADGDLVRTFRLAIQVLHQLERACRAAGITDTVVIKEAIYKLKRDEVDAEKYLRA
ncbi:MAG: DEAD/DEAH box helicase [Planctomycetes bacterium]|nr:DEAD/DEAH box helicase [Planctomycetota bacterium]